MSLLSNQITASGGTVDNFVFGQYVSLYIFSSGSVTLTSSYSITPSTNLSGAFFRVRWSADVTLSTFSVTICGITINQDQVNQSGTFECFYDGSAWTVQYFADGSDLPQNAQGATSVTVPVSGTLTLTAGVDTQYQRLVGAPTTLAANYNVTAGTSGVKAGSSFIIEIAGGVTTGANTFTVFGVTISAQQALNGGVRVDAYFDGSVWRATQTSKPITAADLGAQTALSVVANATNASASPSPLAFANDGDVLVRAGASLIAQKLSTSNFDASTFPLKYATYNLSSSEILNSFSSPVTILAGVAGVTHVPVLVVWETTFNSVAYATNFNGAIRAAGSANPAIIQNGVLGFLVSAFAMTPISTVGSFAQQIIKGANIEYFTQVGNPTAGDGTIKIHLFYIDVA